MLSENWQLANKNKSSDVPSRQITEVLSMREERRNISALLSLAGVAKFFNHIEV
jgi:hypothetical protein